VKLVQTWTSVNGVMIPEFSRRTLKINLVKAKVKIIKLWMSYTIKKFSAKIINSVALNFLFLLTVCLLITITNV
jgi:hypothetical protein